MGQGQQWILWSDTLQNEIGYHRSTVINEYSLIIVTGFACFKLILIILN